MTRLRRWLVTALALAGACAHPSNRELEKLRAVATFAFDAVVDSVNASTVLAVPKSSHTVAVTVATALLCPVEVGRYNSQKLTVYVDDARELKVGSRWWFFAGAWVMGADLAVHEIARFRAPDADTIVVGHFLGPHGPVALIEERVELSSAIVTTNLLIDEQQVLADFAKDKVGAWYGVTVPVSGVLSGNVKIGDSLRVALPIGSIGQWAMIRGSRALPLLLILQSTRDMPADLLVGESKPYYMLRESGGVRAASDSAMVAEILRRQGQVTKGSQGVRWLPHCGEQLSRAP